MNSNNYISIFFFVLLGNFIARTTKAQPYQELPGFDRKVHKIIEWVRPDITMPSKEGFTSEYNKQGKLIRHFHKDQGVEAGQDFQYYPSGSLNKATDHSMSNPLEINYFESDGKFIEEKSFRGKIYRAIYFKTKKGKILERKQYVKGGELGTGFLLRDRTIYEYNPKDSLIKMVEYHHALDRPSRNKKIFTRKTFYEYDSKSGKRSKVTAYDFDESVRMTLNLQYDKKQRLTTAYYEYPADQSYREITYKYKANNIWQIIDESPLRKIVKIFVDGRLIRQRSYTGKELFSVVDYQYVYY